MVLFGNEFDADERAEVGGGLRGGEGDGDVSAVRLRRLPIPLREYGLQEHIRVSKVNPRHRNFVGIDHRSEMTWPP
jgi:hypothetical protein